MTNSYHCSLLTEVQFVSLKIVGEDGKLCFSLVFIFSFEALALKCTLSNVTFPSLIRMSE